MVYTLRFFSTICSLFHNSNVFGSCIIHILNTGCAKNKKKQFQRQNVSTFIVLKTDALSADFRANCEKIVGEKNCY